MNNPEKVEDPYDVYVNAAGEIVDTIASRAKTHGPPELFAETYAGLLNAYLRPVVMSGRAILPADVFVILDLLKTARIACGGPQPDHFHDKLGYSLLGKVHIDQVMARGEVLRREQEAARKAQEGPEAKEAPEPRMRGNPALAHLREGRECPLCGSDGPQCLADGEPCVYTRAPTGAAQ